MFERWLVKYIAFTGKKGWHSYRKWFDDFNVANNWIDHMKYSQKASSCIHIMPNPPERRLLSVDEIKRQKDKG